MFSILSNTGCLSVTDSLIANIITHCLTDVSVLTPPSYRRLKPDRKMGRDEITLKSLNIKTQKKQWEIWPKIKVSSNLDFSYNRTDTGAYDTPKSSSYIGLSSTFWPKWPSARARKVF